MIKDIVVNLSIGEGAAGDYAVSVAAKFDARDWFDEDGAEQAKEVALGDPGGTPQSLADIIEAQRAGRLLAGQNETAVLHRCRANDAGPPCHPPQLCDSNRGIAECFKHGVAKNRVKRRVVKRQSTTVSRNTGEVAPSDGCRIAAGGRAG